ncbi:MAG: hypothetical protein IJS08_19645, partial [Victivallales bacterium]|nr:hypothetical protein [Victivallales bacterium]
VSPLFSTLGKAVDGLATTSLGKVVDGLATTCFENYLYRVINIYLCVSASLRLCVKISAPLRLCVSASLR